MRGNDLEPDERPCEGEAPATASAALVAPDPWARLARLARRLLAAGSVAVCRREGGELVVAAASGSAAYERAHLGRLTELALRARGPVALPAPPSSNDAVRPGAGHALAVPLPVADGVPAVLCALDARSPGWSQEDLATVADLAEAALAEDELLRERERVALALAAGRIAIWELDPLTERVIRPAALAELLRLPPERVEGSLNGLLGFVLEEDRPALLERRQAALAGRAQGYKAEFRVRCGDGRVRWVQLETRIRRDASGVARSVLGVATDVSALKAAEAALRASEERHRLALAAMHGVVYERDFRSGRLSLSGELTAALRLPDETREDDLGAWMERVHPDDRNHVRQTVETVLSSGSATSFSLEYRLLGRDGRWLHVHDRGFVVRDEGGTPLRIAGIVSDITERALAIAGLRQNEQRLRVALASAPVALFEQDRELRYDWVQNTCLPLPPEELVGRTEAEVFGPAAPPLEAMKRRVLEGRAGTAEVAVPLPGGTRIYEIHAEPRHDPAGRVVGLTGAAIDITERKQAEEQREILLRELNHRVKNLLAVVQAIAHQTAARAETVPQFLHAFAGRLGALAMAQGRLTASGWHGVDLRDLVLQTLDPLDLADGRRVRTAVASVPLAAGAAQNLALALHELATNAAKYGALSVPAGRVELSAAVAGTDMAPVLEIVWRERGGPPVRPPGHQGFGTRLLTRVVARQHRGQVHLDWQPEGLACRLVLPLAGVLDKRRPWPPAAG
jgi:PAS domain S-box-containing protein